ncbi:MAG: hypothetical protein KKD28_03835 [Chloroflexi bacterium]|nr:hypothetical protein [Chloroflexota bacterium]MBU1660584.1 hypothetical protein [Chloroflexota bacterium]
MTIPPAPEVEENLRGLIEPVAKTQQDEYKKLGMRERNLTLSVMTVIVIAMIWQQVGSGTSEMARLLSMGTVLWAEVVHVSQQAISLRLAVLPSSLFLGTLNALLTVLQQRWRPSDHCPLKWPGQLSVTVGS